MSYIYIYTLHIIIIYNIIYIYIYQPFMESLYFHQQISDVHPSNLRRSRARRLQARPEDDDDPRELGTWDPGRGSASSPVDFTMDWYGKIAGKTHGKSMGNPFFTQSIEHTYGKNEESFFFFQVSSP